MEGDKSILNIEGKSEIKNTNNNLHVLVEDEEILAYQRQMLYAISYSESSVVHRVPLHLFGAVNDDGSVVYVDGEPFCSVFSSMYTVSLFLWNNNIG